MTPTVRRRVGQGHGWMRHGRRGPGLSYRAGLRILRSDPSLMDRIRANTLLLRDGLVARGLDAGHSTSPVVPLTLGDEWRAYHWARGMLEQGVFVSAVVCPAVAPGMARLRLRATAAHQPEHFDRLFAAIDERIAAEGWVPERTVVDASLETLQQPQSEPGEITRILAAAVCCG